MPGAGSRSSEPLWRAIAVYRFASIGYAVLLVVIHRADYSRLDWAWAVIAVMTGWTVVTTMAYARPPAVLDRPGQHRSRHPDPGHRHHPMPHGLRVLQRRGAEEQAGGDREVGAEQ